MTLVTDHEVQPFDLALCGFHDAWFFHDTIVMQDTAEVTDKAFILLFSVAGLGLLPPAERDGSRQSIVVTQCCCVVYAELCHRVARSWRRVAVS